jgi:hypothetical protein
MTPRKSGSVGGPPRKGGRHLKSVEGERQGELF